jgi:hypothetical protein
VSRDLKKVRTDYEGLVITIGKFKPESLRLCLTVGYNSMFCLNIWGKTEDLKGPIHRFFSPLGFCRKVP